jgi:hypothetical protein
VSIGRNPSYRALIGSMTGLGSNLRWYRSQQSYECVQTQVDVCQPDRKGKFRCGFCSTEIANWAGRRNRIYTVLYPPESWRK